MKSFVIDLLFEEIQKNFKFAYIVDYMKYLIHFKEN